MELFNKFDTKTVKIVKERYDQIKSECSDLVSAEASYHRNCQKSFYARREVPESRDNEGRR